MGKRLLTILLCICALGTGGAYAQRITDSGFSTIAFIKSDGTIQDSSFRVIGHIKSDGTVQDSSFRVIGHVKKDGIIQDASFRVIGHADDIPMKWAAYYFFFRR